MFFPPGETVAFTRLSKLVTRRPTVTTDLKGTAADHSLELHLMCPWNVFF